MLGAVFGLCPATVRESYSRGTCPLGQNNAVPTRVPQWKATSEDGEVPFEGSGAAGWWIKRQLKLKNGSCSS